MLRNYFNRAEKEKTLSLSSVVEIMDDMLKTFPMTKTEHKYLATAKTSILKWLDSVFARIDGDLAQQLLKMLKSYEILLLPKLQVKTEVEKRKKIFNAVTVNRDTLLDMAENALIGCENCTKKDYKECSLRKCFMELEIEPYDLNAEGCQYKVVKVKKEVS